MNAKETKFLIGGMLAEIRRAGISLIDPMRYVGAASDALPWVSFLAIFAPLRET
jgi:hypothetical protein